jgi:hypothetical protein
MSKRDGKVSGIIFATISRRYDMIDIDFILRLQENFQSGEIERSLVSKN